MGAGAAQTREAELSPGTLYVVATPIGNLEDLTFRALRVLQQVDLIAAEDTRHSRKLCNFYAIRTPLTSYFAHNEAVKGEAIIARLKQGKTVALITDAGTPAISDPGYLLVSRCRAEQIPVVAVPGPSAPVAALSISGLPSERFDFFGFLSAKPALRRRQIAELKSRDRTVVFFESPRRLPKTLTIIREELGADRAIAVARELTKFHEELIGGTVQEVIAKLGSGPVRGEIVLLIGPAAQNVQTETVREALLRVREETDLPMRQVVKLVAREFGLPGSDVYQESLQIRDLEGKNGSQRKNPAD